MVTSYTRTAGIDISKKQLDVALHPKPHRAKTYSYTAGNCRTIAQRLLKAEVELVVLEATGGYERMIFHALHRAGLAVHLAQPSRVRSFAAGEGITAKTDRLDAKVLAMFGYKVGKLHLSEPASELLERLTDLQKRQNQLKKMCVAERNRLEKIAAYDKRIAAEIRRSIKRLEKQIAEYDRIMLALVKEDEELARRLQLLDDQYGVAQHTAMTLLIGLPELGKVNRGQIAALVGLACYARDSGDKTSPRHIKGGRQYVRDAIYMANLSNCRSGAALHGYYERLLAAGKKPKVAQIAVARKFLVWLNTVMKDYYAQNPELAAA